MKSQSPAIVTTEVLLCSLKNNVMGSSIASKNTTDGGHDDVIGDRAIVAMRLVPVRAGISLGTIQRNAWIQHGKSCHAQIILHSPHFDSGSKPFLPHMFISLTIRKLVSQIG